MTRAIGEAVRYYRASGPSLKTAEELAEHMTNSGFPYSRSVVANLESGRKRSVDVAEWLALADALRVPPAYLLFRRESPEVEALPGREVTFGEAVRWLVGYPHGVIRGTAMNVHPMFGARSRAIFEAARMQDEFEQAYRRLAELREGQAPAHEVHQAQRVVDLKWEELESARKMLP